MAPLEASDAEGNLGRRLGVAKCRRSEMAKRKAKTRRSNNPHGRPSSGLTERVLLAVSPWMAQSMAAAAARMGISTSEVWRLAARNALGWPSKP